MSIKVMTDIWAHADAKGSELLILLALADFADDNGENIYPSMQTLAKKTRLHETQARRIVKSLVKRDLLEVTEQGGWKHGRNRSNSYRIKLENLCGGILPPPPSRPRAHRGRADDTTVVSPTRDDPSYNRKKKPPVKEERPPRAQSRKSYRPDAGIDPLSR